MADIRINALANTASSTASDDYLAVDGTTNGTRKLSAYSPTFGGNLTVSGTGTSSFAGYLTIGRTDISSANLGYSNVTYPYAKTDTTLRNVASWSSNETAGSSWKLILTSKGNATAASRFFSLQTSNEGVANNGILALQDGGGVVTLGTTTDGGNGIIQLATHTTSAGGIGFGANMSLYKGANGLFGFDDTSGANDTRIFLYNNGTFRGAVEAYGVASAVYLGAASTGWSTYITSGNQAIALTLDSSQNAIFAGSTGVQLKNDSFLYFGSTVRTAVKGNSTGSLELYANNGLSLTLDSSQNATFAGTIKPQQAATASAPTYVKGAIYFDTTLNKLRVGGATGWETITSV